MGIEHEQWDIITSIGWTALVVAAGRARERHLPDGLVDDPWAERFVAAARPPSRIPVRPDEDWVFAPGTDERLRAEAGRFWDALASYQGVRSRFFDRALDEAVDGGTRQVVLLAAGLDARAFRMPWGPSVTVFEIDQQGVLAFKDDVVRAHGGSPSCDRRTVGVDLRDDWAAALRAAGFEPARPTAWLAEGLLPYLPAAAQEYLLRTVGELSSPGSVFAVEHVAGVQDLLAGQDGVAAITAPFGLSLPDLPSREPRTPAPERMAELGWDVTVRFGGDVARGYGREPGTLTNGQVFAGHLVVGTKG